MLYLGRFTSRESLTRSLDAHTPDLLDSSVPSDPSDPLDPLDPSDPSDPLDSLDPNLASVRTSNPHCPPVGWFNGSQAHVGMLDHVMSADLGSLKTGIPVLGHVTG